MINKELLAKLRGKVKAEKEPQQREATKQKEIVRQIIVSEPIVTIGNRPDAMQNRDKLIPELLRYMADLRAFLKHIRRENIHDLACKEYASQIRQSLDETDELIVDIAERQSTILASDGFQFSDDYKLIPKVKSVVYGDYEI
jgi:hypothetical protein